MNEILRATQVARRLMEAYSMTDRIAVDATAGNGYDTLFLAQKVGPQGRVYAFDIQEEALGKTRQLLDKNQCLKRVELIQDGHEHLRQYVKENIHGLIYNLGYLPGGDKRRVTSSTTTLQSLKQGLELLAPGGVVSLITYPGHPGGREEHDHVLGFVEQLSSPPWNVLTWKRLNGSKDAPCLLIVEKQGSLEGREPSEV